MTRAFPSVGARQLQIEDRPGQPGFPALLFYPAESSAAPIAIGPFALTVAENAPIPDDRFPLIVISHGSGGSYLAYRTIGMHLAEHGYLVVSLEHPGNNRRDNSLEGSHQNLENRPRHVRRLIDWLLAERDLGPHIDAARMALIGHSMGGYTALALAGGKPQAEPGRLVAVEADRRIKALVLLAPATPWYLAPDALRDVTVPMLILVAEHDRYTPQWHADLVLDRVPDRSAVTVETVHNAGHYSFLSPFPTQLASPTFLPSTDPAGFDREAFHRQLPARIRTYLDAQLQFTAPVGGR